MLAHLSLGFVVELDDPLADAQASPTRPETQPGIRGVLLIVDALPTLEHPDQLFVLAPDPFIATGNALVESNGIGQ